MADMTYSDSAASIRNNQWFRGRVDVSVSKYANYLINTPSSDPDYTKKISQGQRLIASNVQIVDGLMVALSGDAEVLASGPSMPDGQLQSIVEKMIPMLWPDTGAPAAFGRVPYGGITPVPPPPPATKPS